MLDPSSDAVAAPSLDALTIARRVCTLDVQAREARDAPNDTRHHQANAPGTRTCRERDRRIRSAGRSRADGVHVARAAQRTCNAAAHGHRIGDRTGDADGSTCAGAAIRNADDDPVRPARAVVDGAAAERVGADR